MIQYRKFEAAKRAAEKFGGGTIRSGVRTETYREGAHTKTREVRYYYVSAT